MGRRNIFDVLKGEVDIQDRIVDIDDLIYEAQIDGNFIEDFFETEILPKWKQRNYYRSVDMIRERLGIDSINLKKD